VGKGGDEEGKTPETKISQKGEFSSRGSKHRAQEEEGIWLCPWGQSVAKECGVGTMSGLLERSGKQDGGGCEEGIQRARGGKTPGTLLARTPEKIERLAKIQLFSSGFEMIVVQGSGKR